MSGAGLSEYERERLQRLQRNQQMLHELGIDKASNPTMVDASKVRYVLAVSPFVVLREALMQVSVESSINVLKIIHFVR
jgi:hypothetical protein